MDRSEIMTILPHRDAMLLLDTADLCGDGSARGTYRARGDEWFFRGHFPENPVMPGVIQCEIIAQASCVLMREKMQGATPYYTGIDKVRFRRPVRPGDLLEISTRLERSKLNLFVIRGEARVDGELCSSGEFTFMLVK